MDRTTEPIREHDAVSVAVCGGNPIVGEVLSLLLQRVGYDAHFLAETAIDDVHLSSDRYQLLLLAPGLSRTCRRNVLSQVASMPGDQLSVVELVTVSGESRLSEECARILWPCPVERLQREIATVLRARYSREK